MMRAGGASARRKGEPVWVLVAIIGGWIGVRVATWDIAGADPVGDPGLLGTAIRHAVPWIGYAPPPVHFVAPVAPVVPFGAGMEQPPMPLVRPAPYALEMLRRPVAMPGMPGTSAVGGHELLWLAAVANMPLAYDLAGLGAQAHRAVFDAAGALPVSTVEAIATLPDTQLVSPRAAPFLEAPASTLGTGSARPALPRWSGDAWALLRRDGNVLPVGSLLLPSYGANQVGAVLRYRLAPASGYKPTVYARAYGALNGSGEREVAAGLSARPLPAVPLVAMAEGRLSRFDNGASHLRPAVTLVTELPPVMLPGALRAETYAQGGYVGGTGATPFVDGQFRLERIVQKLGRTEWRLGGGVWGGAQKSAGRLDVGPTATVAFASARAGAHVSVDWRFRLAGDAMPGSGPAVTLAAGF
jgi:hypothetical protein